MFGQGFQQPYGKALQPQAGEGQDEVLLLIALASPVMATEQAFPPSSIGAPELKTLPAGLLLKASAPGNYFDHSNRLFGPLFRYISSHQIAMTTPVEARIDGAAMFFGWQRVSG